MVNPSAMILSGVMMLDYIGWREAGKLIVEALEKTIANKTVTYDLARKIKDSVLLKSSEFGEAIAKNIASSGA